MWRRAAVLWGLAAASAWAGPTVSGVVSIAGAPRAGVSVSLGDARATTDAKGRYTLEAKWPDAPKAELAGWRFEAVRKAEGPDGVVDFVAAGARLEGHLPSSLAEAPLVTDGVRQALVTREAPGGPWRWVLERVPPGEVRLTATAKGAALRLHPDTRTPLVVDLRGRSGLDFLRVCTLTGTLELKSPGGAGQPQPPAVVTVDVSPRLWSQEPGARQMSQIGQQFKPQLLVVKKGDTVEFVNEERNQRTEHAVDLGPPNPRRFPPSTRGVTGRPVFSNEGATHVSCRIHSNMHADVYVAKGPYFTVTGADGKWRIEDVPEGAWALTAWEPNGAKVTLSGKVDACGPPVTVRLTQAPPPVRPCLPGDRYCGDDVPMP